jgi:hypothetical protein
MNRALLLVLVLAGCGADPWVADASNPGACPRSFDEVCPHRGPDPAWCEPGFTCTWQRDQGRQLGVFSCGGSCKTYSVR